MKVMKNGLFAIFGVAVLAFAAFVPGAHAASGPQLLITWQATGSSAPSGYAGKILPGINTPVTASVAVVQANGQPANLSGNTIYWYLDNNEIGGGIGQQTISFNAVGHTEIMALRVDITDYPTGELIYTERVPVVDPKVVIVAPYAADLFSGSSLAVTAAPYYFPSSDAKNLVLSWSVNGQTVTNQENPTDLTINVPAGTPVGYGLNINLGAQESDDPLLTAQSTVTLTQGQ